MSSRDDGTMLDRTLTDTQDSATVIRRRDFCARAGGNYDAAVHQVIEYGPEYSYAKIIEVAKSDAGKVHADALYTESIGLGLFLPVADCVATIIYDAKRHTLTLAHLGRHSSVAKLMTGAINFMVEKGSNVQNLIIWMAPSAKQSEYRMEYFEHQNDRDWHDFAIVRESGVYLDLPGYNARLAETAGVPKDQIFISSVNTMTSPDYFSHAAGDTNGRFAVLAQILER